MFFLLIILSLSLLRGNMRKLLACRAKIAANNKANAC